MGCPDIYGTEKFDANKYIQTNPWWTVAASPFFWYFGDETTCATASYEQQNRTGDYFTVVNSQFLGGDKGALSYHRTTSYGTAVPTPGKPGTLSVAFFETDPNPALGNYIIIDTDNEYYSFVFSCVPGAGGPGHYGVDFWILSKDQNLGSWEVEGLIKRAKKFTRDEFQWEEAEDFFGEYVKQMQTEGCPPFDPFDGSTPVCTICEET